MDVAVVTGAGRGLGCALAIRLAQRGLAVLASDVDAEAAERTAAAIGEPAWSAAADVRDPMALRSLAAQASERGRLAVWVNNAGVARSGWIWEHSDDEVEATVRINLLGMLHGSRAAIDTMRKAGGEGRILNVASLSALGPTPGLGVYGATKHGVLAFSLSLQGELRDAGLPIEVRVLCPDAIVTDMVRDVADDEKALLLFTGTRLLDVDEVADEAMKLLYGRRLKAVVPRHRGVIVRTLMFAPRLGHRLLPILNRTIGRRNRQRWEKQLSR